MRRRTPKSSSMQRRQEGHESLHQEAERVFLVSSCAKQSRAFHISPSCLPLLNSRSQIMSILNNGESAFKAQPIATRTVLLSRFCSTRVRWL